MSPMLLLANMYPVGKVLNHFHKLLSWDSWYGCWFKINNALQWYASYCHANFPIGIPKDKNLEGSNLRNVLTTSANDQSVKKTLS